MFKFKNILIKYFLVSLFLSFLFFFVSVYGLSEIFNLLYNISLSSFKPKLYNLKHYFFLEYTQKVELLLIFSFSYYLISIIIGFLFIQFLSLYGVLILCLSSLSIFLYTLIFSFEYFIYTNQFCFFSAFKWFKVSSDVYVYLDFFFDQTSFCFMLLTVVIAFFTNIYAFSYFKNEPDVERFILFLNSFVYSMLFLVSSGNLINFFFGWELIGLTSFLLINFWSTRATTFKSSFKAYSFNKFSDCCVFMGVILLFNSSSTIKFSEILSLGGLNSNFFLNSSFLINSNIQLFTFFFLTAAFIKSAQLGFHIWLPDSMEAPVPASALIHSATLVSAGVFLILRMHCLLSLSSYFFFILALVGSTTAFVGGVSAAFQFDLKKILAYSTISHCGFLIFLCSSNNLYIVLLYLLVHGFFKAAAFLSVGNIIKFSRGYQDIRKMGMYWKYLISDFFLLLFSLIILSGAPFFFGFYIKHFLFLLNCNFYFKIFVYIFIMLAALSGLFYSYKIIFYVFFDFKKSHSSVYLTNSKKNLSFYKYSNSSPASNLSIFFLIVFAIVIVLLYFNRFYFNFFFNYKGDDLLLSLDYQRFLDLNVDFQFFFSYLNTIVFILFLFLIFFKWNYKYVSDIRFCIFVFIFFIFFYVFV